MAKKRKISRKRMEDFRRWTLSASGEELGRYTNLIPVSLQKAADAFGLDAGSEGHREVLVRILAQLMFGDGKRGRPRMTHKWFEQREYDLGAHFHELKRERPDIKLSEAARFILRRYPEEYADCKGKERALARRIRDAVRFYEWCHEQDEAQEEERRR
jgi:hypothetical protein